VQQWDQNGLNNLKKENTMKTYTNTVVINGMRYTNTVEAENYKKALEIQRDRKRKSKNTFEGRLILS
jgi:hypothetical protein